VAHDFHNLLQNVSVCMQLMKIKAENPEDIRRWADSGLRAVAQGAKLVAQLLTFSREQSPISARLCVSEHIGAMEELLRRTLPGSIKLDFHLDTTGCLVMINATQLEPSVLNMVINSRDAMQGSGSISIATRRTQICDHAGLPDGEYVALTIGDDGPGMPLDVAVRAFEPFFTTKKDGKGTGLGLSQVMGVAQRAGGTAQITSSGDSGTAITMLLRIVAEGHPPQENVIRVVPDNEPSRARILVVDDVDEIRVPLAALLAAQGYYVTSVASGVDALKAIESSLPDLVLTDLDMQGMGGALLARVIGEMYPRTPILFMSAHVDHDIALDSLPVGAVLLRKPVLVERLVTGIQELLATATDGKD
jgi:CheY-like chemotaxis protein